MSKLRLYLWVFPKKCYGLWDIRKLWLFPANRLGKYKNVWVIGAMGYERFDCTCFLLQPSLMFQGNNFHLQSSEISPEQQHPPPGRIINFALDSSSSQTGSMLNRKKRKKKQFWSHSFQSSSTTFRVQPAAHTHIWVLEIPTSPARPSKKIKLQIYLNYPHN